MPRSTMRHDEMFRKPGWIYAIQREDTLEIKLGYTTRSLSQRLTSIQKAIGASIHFLAAIAVANDLWPTEQLTLLAFADYRQRGEWFAMSWSPAAFINAVAHARERLAKKDADEDDAHAA